MNKKKQLCLISLLIIYLLFLISCNNKHSFKEIVKLKAVFFLKLNKLQTKELNDIFSDDSSLNILNKEIIPKHGKYICLPENSGLFSEIRGNLFDLKNRILTFFVVSIQALGEKGFLKKRLLFVTKDIETIKYNYVITSWNFDFKIKRNKDQTINIKSKDLTATFKPKQDSKYFKFIVSPEISSDIYIKYGNKRSRQVKIKVASFGNIYSFKTDDILKKDNTYELQISDFSTDLSIEKDFDLVFKPIRTRDMVIDIYDTIPTKGRIKCHEDDIKVVFPYEKSIIEKKENSIYVNGKSNFNNLFLLTDNDYSEFKASNIDFKISKKITDQNISQKQLSIFTTILSDLTDINLKNKDVFVFSGRSSGIIEYPLILLNPKTLYRRPDNTLMTFNQTLKKNLLHEITHLYTGKLPHFNPYFYEGMTTFLEFYIFSGLYNDDLLRFIDSDISLKDFKEISHGLIIENLLKRDDVYYTGASFFYSLFKKDNDIIKKILNKKAPADIADALDLN